MRLPLQPDDQTVAGAWSRIIQSVRWGCFLPCPIAFVRWCQRSKRTLSPYLWGFPVRGGASPLTVMALFCPHLRPGAGDGDIFCQSLFVSSSAFLDGSFAATCAAELCQVTPCCCLEFQGGNTTGTAVLHRVLTGNFRDRGNQGKEIFWDRLSVWIGLLLLLHRSTAEPLWRDCCPPIYYTPLI